jgi:hypothetical protein
MFRVFISASIYRIHNITDVESTSRARSNIDLALQIKLAFVHISLLLRLNVPPILFLFQFPLRISHPVVHINPVSPYIVLKLLPLPALEFMEFFEISEPLGRGLEAWFLTVNSFSEELFGADLSRGSRFILDPRRAS